MFKPFSINITLHCAVCCIMSADLKTTLFYKLISSFKVPQDFLQILRKHSITPLTSQMFAGKRDKQCFSYMYYLFILGFSKLTSTKSLINDIIDWASGHDERLCIGFDPSSSCQVLLENCVCMANSYTDR